ncbi:LacI family DNA-binding transcriptional regulator [Microbacterium jejuense]|uniref:LacI family DNA-binding transcriptional regulator n=1 Tax=Microbacterium jejuense TaxID=1263637 RepID=A0ABS7HQ29_9MICO|nr:LacI family DNA-binding transcriptional regulator [Microbacterium jejuense]MBW9094820.1 LacI family DNA-binding transcriptional regulator [Microbacterium jejuense]
MARPTVLDVAAAAGVSRATAARVLAGAENVDPAMTAAVRKHAELLGYETNSAARMLRGGRAGAIGLILAFNELGSIGGTFFTSVLKGAAMGLSAGEVQPVLLPADLEDRERIPRFLRSGSVDGAIVILQHEITHLVDQIMDSPVPIAWVGRPADDVGSAPIVVDCDNYDGGVQAGRALIEAGRRRIGIITGPPDMAQASARAQGWTDELARHGISPGPIVHGDFTVDSGAAAMARLLQRDPQLDGVFACSDLMASGALRVLQAAGRAVPTDVSLIGFDDVAIATASNPPLTTVRQPLEEMGRTAAEALLARVRGQDVASEHILPTALIRRESL